MKKTSLITLLFALMAMLCIGCGTAETTDTPDTESTNIATATATETTPATTAASQTAAAPKDNYPSNHPAMGTTAVDLMGESHRLSRWIGQTPVVVNFWGTWCPPCRREIPGLVRLYEEYGGRVEILSFAIEKRAGPQQVQQFVDRAGMKWPQFMSNDQVMRAFGYDGAVPLTVFLDRNGNEVGRHRGGRPYEAFKPDFKKIAK